MALNIKKYKKKLDKIDQVLDANAEKLAKDVDKLAEVVEEELKKSIYEDDDFERTAIQALIRWVKSQEDYDQLSINSVSMKAFELLSEEKSQLLEFFKMGFQYGLLQTDENVEDYDMKEVENIAKEYYDNLYYETP